MTQTIDMACMRHLNLFSKVTGVRTKNCFFYNNALIFAVPKFFISQAIGEQGSNVKQMSNILNTRIKVVIAPESIVDAERFISAIIAPLDFQGLEITPTEIIIAANRQSKASLIGRNKKRLEELNEITKICFGKTAKIV